MSIGDGPPVEANPSTDSVDGEKVASMAIERTVVSGQPWFWRVWGAKAFWRGLIVGLFPALGIWLWILPFVAQWPESVNAQLFLLHFWIFWFCLFTALLALFLNTLAGRNSLSFLLGWLPASLFTVFSLFVVLNQLAAPLLNVTLLQPWVDPVSDTITLQPGQIATADLIAVTYLSYDKLPEGERVDLIIHVRLQNLFADDLNLLPLKFHTVTHNLDDSDNSAELTADGFDYRGNNLFGHNGEISLKGWSTLEGDLIFSYSSAPGTPLPDQFIWSEGPQKHFIWQMSAQQ
ncbi:hypothetical protein [Tengunoibacter tsumagoiensis]|nr:hypothetical protein [Tengunoibacter tsumagoiensis]